MESVKLGNQQAYVELGIKNNRQYYVCQEKGHQGNTIQRIGIKARPMRCGRDHDDRNHRFTRYESSVGSIHHLT